MSHVRTAAFPQVFLLMQARHPFFLIPVFLTLSSAMAPAQAPAPPTISSTSPTQRTAGSAGFTLYLAACSVRPGWSEAEMDGRMELVLLLPGPEQLGQRSASCDRRTRFFHRHAGGPFMAGASERQAVLFAGCLLREHGFCQRSVFPNQSVVRRLAALYEFERVGKNHDPAIEILGLHDSGRME